MADNFVGDIRPVGFNFAPYGWALCNGKLMPISQNTALFSLLGTYYGGDGKSTFGLPNLQGQMAVGRGQGPGLFSYYIGQAGGSATVTLLSNQVPAHTHTLPVDTAAGTANAPSGSLSSLRTLAVALNQLPPAIPLPPPPAASWQLLPLVSQAATSHTTT